MKLPFRFRSTRTLIALTALFGLTACDIYPDSGKWGGDLTVHDDITQQSYTCSADVDISHTESVISLNSFDTYCGPDSLHWAPSALNRRGSSLYLGDQQVGEIYSDGSVHVEIDNPYFNAQYPRNADRLDLTWSRMGDDLQFTLTEWYGNEARTMESSLVRVM